MAHHKRRKPKSSRAGCLLCKPHKANGAKSRLCNQTPQEKRSRATHREQVGECEPLAASSHASSASEG